MKVHYESLTGKELTALAEKLTGVGSSTQDSGALARVQTGDTVHEQWQQPQWYSWYEQWKQPLKYEEFTVQNSKKIQVEPNNEGIRALVARYIDNPGTKYLIIAKGIGSHDDDARHWWVKCICKELVYGAFHVKHIEHTGMGISGAEQLLEIPFKSLWFCLVPLLQP